VARAGEVAERVEAGGGAAVTPSATVTDTLQRQYQADSPHRHPGPAARSGASPGRIASAVRRVPPFWRKSLSAAWVGDQGGMLAFG
jgi:hypothetical protein